MEFDSMKKSIWIGNDHREQDVRDVARHSILRRLTGNISLHDISMPELRAQGIYTRPTKRNANGRLIDVLSQREDYDGSISTEHAIARFMTLHLAKTGMALFADCDILARVDLASLFEGLDRKFAIHCVKHQYAPTSKTKMDGQLQTVYARKNWSSVMVFNCDHPANKKLTLELINTLPGRDLHRFCWLKDNEIGELDPKWNFLVGHSDPEKIDPAIVHFTEGPPNMAGYENCLFADEWREEFAACRSML